MAKTDGSDKISVILKIWKCATIFNVGAHFSYYYGTHASYIHVNILYVLKAWNIWHFDMRKIKIFHHQWCSDTTCVQNILQVVVIFTFDETWLSSLIYQKESKPWKTPKHIVTNSKKKLHGRFYIPIHPTGDTTNQYSQLNLFKPD